MYHKLSATIITLNEEKNIGRCIDALMPIADEIIVLDAFSSDATAEICQSKGVRFIQRAWEGYSSSKNYVNSLAEFPYIFSVDADEAPDKTLQAAILAEKSTGFKGIYTVNRLTNYCGKWIKHSGWYPDIKVRLFPRNSSKWVGEYVHEELEITGNPKPKLLEGHLLHYSYYDYKNHRERADKYSRLTAQKMNSKGKTAAFYKPLLSGIGRFISMYILKRGFLDGKMGYKIACISAQSNIFKYQELRRLNKKEHGSNE